MDYTALTLDALLDCNVIDLRPKGDEYPHTHGVRLRPHERAIHNLKSPHARPAKVMIALTERGDVLEQYRHHLRPLRF